MSVAAESGASAATGGTVLAVEELSLSIAGVDVVDRVSFSLGHGETLALVGESGCGKSITALAMMGLLPPAVRRRAGRVRLGDKEVTGLPAAELRALRGDRMSMIFQDPIGSLNALLTVEEQMIEALLAHRRVKHRRARDEAVRMLSAVGIPSPAARLRQYPFELSGGMCQRVMIATALICRPEVLIADEPTTALDVTIQAQILSLIKSLQAETGTAVLLITHDMGVVAEMADRVAVMYAGRIIEAGPTEPLFADPRHPYTRRLLGAIPRLDGVRKTRLPTVEGTVPEPKHFPTGCRFRDRCPLAVEICAEVPPLTDLGRTSHAVACWRADDMDLLP